MHTHSDISGAALEQWNTEQKKNKKKNQNPAALVCGLKQKRQAPQKAGSYVWSPQHYFWLWEWFCGTISCKPLHLLRIIDFSLINEGVIKIT